MAIVKFMKASSAEAMTRQLNGIITGKRDLVRGRDQSGNPPAAPNNLFKHPVDGLTLIFTTPGFTVTFSADLHLKDIVDEINTAAGTDIAYLYKVDANGGMVLAFWDDTTPVVMLHTGTANAYFGFSVTAADPDLTQTPVDPTKIKSMIMDPNNRQFITFYTT